MFDEAASISVLSSIPDVETIYTPSVTDQGTDGGFELVAADSDDSEESDESELYHSVDVDSGCSTSLLPVVYDHEWAHGRRYHGYKRGRYPLPNDTFEQQREDTLHALMLELTQGHLFFADIGEYPQKIIDIGTGTGTWAIDVADLYPSASVIGTDLSPIQPTWLPVNVRMFVEDCEEPDWLHGSGYDLVHFRGMASSVQDLDGLLAKAYPHIAEGGWAEIQEFIPQILCDDGSMKENDPLVAFARLGMQGLEKFGCTIYDADSLQATLERAGFTNVQCITKKVPISTWAHSRQLQTVGVFMKAFVLDTLGAFTAKPLAALGIAEADRRDLARRVKESLDNDRIHRYVNCVFCFAQKAASPVSDSESYVVSESQSYVVTDSQSSF